MKDYTPSISMLIDEFAKLPGIGRKTASKLAFWNISRDLKQVEQFARILVETKNKIKFCNICGHFSEEENCEICKDQNRKKDTILVVEEARDVFVFEKIGDYEGKYHVLNGVISPLDGVGPDDIRLKELVQRSKDVKEVIVATNPTVEGEATAMYISRILSPMDIKVSRIARGVSVGSDLEYADEVTLLKALEGRTEIL